MAITAINHPNSPAPVQQPAWAQISTDNYYTPAVLPWFKLAFTFDGCTAAAQGFTISVDGVTFNFVSVLASPSSTQFRYNSDPKPLADWVDDLLTDIKKNLSFMRYFSISLEYPAPGEITVKFTSKLSHTLSNQAETMTNTTISVDNTYTPASKTPNFTLLVELYTEQAWKDGDYQLLHSYEAIPDLDGHAWIDLGPQLRAILQPTVPSYGLTAPTVQILTSVLRQYFLRVAERSGDAVTVGAYVLPESEGQAWLASDNEDQYSSGSLLIRLITEKAFLTHRPKRKVVYPNQLEYLYYMNLGDGEQQIQLDVTAYFTDGTNQSATRVTPGAGNVAPPMGIWCLPAGYEQLNVAGINGAKTVLYYTVQVTTYTVPSEIMTYVVHHASHIHYTSLLIQNAYGCFDTLRLDGPLQEQVNRQQDVVEQALEPNMSRQDSQLHTLRDDHRMTFSVTGGPFTKSEARYLQDLLLSRGKAYLDRNGEWVPIIITNSLVPLVNEKDQLHQVKIDFQYAFHQINYVK